MIKRMFITFIAFLLLSHIVGCTKSAVVTTFLPKQIYFSEYNNRSYKVVKEIDIRLGKPISGFLGIPLTDQPDIPAIVQSEINSVNGDAIMDMDIKYEMKMVYLVLWTFLYPTYHISGKVISYESI